MIYWQSVQRNFRFSEETLSNTHLEVERRTLSVPDRLSIRLLMSLS